MKINSIKLEYDKNKKESTVCEINGVNYINADYLLIEANAYPLSWKAQIGHVKIRLIDKIALWLKSLHN